VGGRAAKAKRASDLLRPNNAKATCAPVDHLEQRREKAVRAGGRVCPAPVAPRFSIGTPLRAGETTACVFSFWWRRTPRPRRRRRGPGVACRPFPDVTRRWIRGKRNCSLHPQKGFQTTRPSAWVSEPRHHSTEGPMCSPVRPRHYHGTEFRGSASNFHLLRFQVLGPRGALLVCGTHR